MIKSITNFLIIFVYSSLKENETLIFSVIVLIKSKTTITLI